MAEDINISTTTAQGLINNRFICVPQAAYNIECDNRFLLPFTQNGRFGLINRAGKVILEAEYDIILDSAQTADDFVRVGKYRYTNYASKIGKANIYRQSHIGLIDTNGIFLIPLEYKRIELPYKSSDVFVVENAECGHCVIDLNGQEVVPPRKYSYIDGFSNGYARVKKNDLWGIIDEQGNEILSCEYPNIWNFYKKNYPTAIVVTDNGQMKFHFETQKLIKTLSELKPHKVSTKTINIFDNQGSHYGEFEGSYAQDVMGYSDDVINDAFEGDPDAYWNID